MTRRTPSQAGFTFVEMMIGVVVFVIVMWAMTSLLGSTSDLSETSHVHTRAVAEHRRNLESLSSVLRVADIRSLGGFVPEDPTAIPRVATQPSFNRVTGVDRFDMTLAPTERILWRPSPQPVNGIANPGALWLIGDGEARVVADRVPQGGFELRQEGAVLAIRLTTYYATDADRTTSITSETAVTLRN